MPLRNANKKGPEIESLLAFAFGVMFCCLLAYAALREAPITNPAQFFLLRVLAALSCAGVAAIIPGMLNVRIGHGALVVVRGAGALAVFVLVFSINPPELIAPVGEEAKRAAMEANYGQRLYRDAIRIADDILKAKPDDAQALNIKGGVAFYDGDMEGAVEFFRRAHQSRPSDVTISSNYANALLEIGAYDKAVDLFKLIDDGKRDRTFTLGRAYLYQGNFTKAHELLQQIPDNYWHGAAKILDSAALMSLASTETSERASFENQARQKFHEGYSQDSVYWDRIFGGGKDIHLSYNKVIPIVEQFYRQIIANKN
jgi:tetratricopeptide (TPR) repeat protein